MATIGSMPDADYAEEFKPHGSTVFLCGLTQFHGFAKSSAIPLGRMNYSISKIKSGFADAVWPNLPVANVDQFLPQSSDHRPRTSARLAHDGERLWGRFEVEDRYVRCARSEYGSEVWKDSCVEFFVEPNAGSGYFNFEFNCGGAFLVNHIIDPTRTLTGFKNFTRLPESAVEDVTVRTSLPRTIEPEICEVLNWTLEFQIPVRLLERFVGRIGNVSGQTWRGNFFKCAEENSHPHWAAWSAVNEFNFHEPQRFGTLRFM